MSSIFSSDFCVSSRRGLNRAIASPSWCYRRSIRQENGRDPDGTEAHELPDGSALPDARRSRARRSRGSGRSAVRGRASGWGLTGRAQPIIALERSELGAPTSDRECPSSVPARKGHRGGEALLGASDLHPPVPTGLRGRSRGRTTKGLMTPAIGGRLTPPRQSRDVSYWTRWMVSRTARRQRFNRFNMAFTLRTRDYYHGSA